MKQDVLLKNAKREGMRQWIEEVTNFLKEQPKQLEAYDDLLVRRLIERITVRERNLTIEFKTGIEIEKGI